MHSLNTQNTAEIIERSISGSNRESILSTLVSSELEVLTLEKQQHTMVKGEQLFMQSDPAEKLFLITQGRIKLVRRLNNGSEVILDIRKTGDFIGEEVFLNQEKYPMSAICIEDALACFFSKRQFEQLVFDNPAIGLQVIRKLSERISSFASRVSSLAVTGIEDRVYNVLCTIAKDHGATNPRGIMIQFPLTHKDLSFLTGAHRVTITRTIQALKRSGKIFLEDNKLILAAKVS
jgi:CRP/FNR family transcriptional regulator